MLWVPSVRLVSGGAAYTSNPGTFKMKELILACASMVGGFSIRAPREPQRANISAEIHLNLDECSPTRCKVNEKHPESGQICGERHWSWPARRDDLRDKRRETSEELTHCQTAVSRGQFQPAGCLWKTEGQKRGGLSHKEGRERTTSANRD